MGWSCRLNRSAYPVIEHIQREARHIYAESGDNYLFMAQSRFDPAVARGNRVVASRFEDGTITHADNLKSGVHTPYKTVQIQRHTELELRFTDRVIQELHPGVRETIRMGSNLFVTYPGYSDYRHIPLVARELRSNCQDHLIAGNDVRGVVAA